MKKGYRFQKINKAYTFSDNYLVDGVHERTTRKRKGETLFPEFSMFFRIQGDADDCLKPPTSLPDSIRIPIFEGFKCFLEHKAASIQHRQVRRG